MISKLTASMTVLEGNTIIRYLQLAAPEIQDTKRDTAHGEAIFFSIAGGGEGRIFCAVSPFKGDAGPTILEFDDSGQLLDRYRAQPAVLPQFQNDKNLQGVSSPLAIAVDGDELFIQSGMKANSTIIWYPLPR